MLYPVFLVQIVEMMHQEKTTLGLVAYQQKCQILKNKPEISTVGKQSTDHWESWTLNFWCLYIWWCKILCFL